MCVHFFWYLIIYIFRKPILWVVGIFLFLTGIFDADAPDFLRFWAWGIVAAFVFAIGNAACEEFKSRRSSHQEDDDYDASAPRSSRNHPQP